MLRKRYYLHEGKRRAPKGALTDPKKADRDKMYTVWERHPHKDSWMIMRSFPGIYFRPGTEGTEYIKFPKYLVMLQGVNPNI